MKELMNSWASKSAVSVYRPLGSARDRAKMEGRCDPLFLSSLGRTDQVTLSLGYPTHNTSAPGTGSLSGLSTLPRIECLIVVCSGVFGAVGGRSSRAASALGGGLWLSVGAGRACA